MTSSHWLSSVPAERPVSASKSLPALSESFLESRDSLTLRTCRKEESNGFESIHKVSDFGNFTAAGNNG